ncbi:MAG: hypothetical protein ACI9EW_001520 [Cellvibrionaceae bacterium]|jgi:hypothetical protein
MSEEQFNGLPMPVFTAFGWAGEDAAIKFALSQLELFINGLHEIISEKARFHLPHHGLNQDARVAWFAINREPEVGPYVAFVARPNAFEMRISITDPATINRGLRAAEKDLQKWFRMLNDLGDGWHLQIEQRLKEDEAVEFGHYGDLFKDSVTALDFESLNKATSRAAFLNTEEKWTVPVFVTRRMTADQAAGMGRDLINFMSVELDKVLDVVALFSRTSKESKAAAAKTKSKGATRTRKTAGRPPKVVVEAVPQTFSYVAELKGLHIRKGFINLTPEHWPFFTEGKRMETRPITIKYAEASDASCAVWRLQPDDQARLILSEPAHAWLLTTFSANSKVTVDALRTLENQIEVTLSPVE